MTVYLGGIVSDFDSAEIQIKPAYGYQTKQE